MSKSSWKDQITKKWGPHSHCPICGKAMGTDKQFCSQSCSQPFDHLQLTEYIKEKTVFFCFYREVGEIFTPHTPPLSLYIYNK